MRAKYNKDQERLENAITKPKSASSIYEEQLEEGQAEHNRSSKGLFMSSIAGGMEVGFTLLLAGTMYTMFNEEISSSFMHWLLALCYPVGFVFVIIGRSELFTEHTNLAFTPVLNGIVNVKSLLRVWGLVYLGNLIGGYLISFILSVLGPGMKIISVDAFYELAHKLVDHPIHMILISSMVAGWLMGLLSWLLSSSQETISRIFMIFLVTSLIGLGGLHHSIVGSIEVFAGLLVTDITFEQYGYFQIFSTIGNIAGGVIFVAVLKFSAIKKNK